MIIKIDKKGRFYLPKAIRKLLGITDKIEIRIEKNKLIMTKGE